MGEGIKLGIEIFIFLVSGIGLYYSNKYQVQKNTEDIKKLEDELTEHMKEAPKCYKRFEQIQLDIQKLATEEEMKETYQKQIVSDILTPILKEMNDNIKTYVDIKSGILTREIEMLRTDNQLFKREIKDYLKELKNENRDSIKQIVNALKK